MQSSIDELQAGDVIAIKYRVWCDLREGAALEDRWLTAQIVESAEDARPIARLADGQLTEIRAFMSWRYVARAAGRARAPQAVKRERDRALLAWA